MPFRDPFEAAAAILAACQSGSAWDPAALDCLIGADSPALFSHLVEPLSDAFEPALCDAYAALFATVISRVSPGLEAAALIQRYRQIRQPRPFAGDAADVCVLSRITLGADIAVTSVFLDAAKRRFPRARIHFAGPAKNYELFDADPRIQHLPAPYLRHGSLAERIAAGLSLREALPPGALLLDPDSRLTQLGLLPVVPAGRHLFFESRSYGGADSGQSITALAQHWVAEVLGIPDARNYMRTQAVPLQTGPGMIASSLGVGGNPAKRVADPFEAELMQALASTGRPLLVDLGAGGEEEARVRGALAGVPSSRNIGVWNGAFANFASSISAASLYVGYDSSGQHAAAAFGIPRITVFAGFPNQRFLARWQPCGQGSSRSILASADAAEAIEQLRANLADLLRHGGGS